MRIYIDKLDDDAYLVEYPSAGRFGVTDQKKKYCKDFKTMCYFLSWELNETDVPWPVETIKVRA